MNYQLRTVLSSDLDYEDMVIYVFSQSGMIAVVDQEKGNTRKEIEIVHPEYKKVRTYSLIELKECLEKAERRLDESQRTGEPFLDDSKKFPDDEQPTE